MKLELFIAKRLVLKRQASTFSKPIVRIAIISIALGLAVMIVSVAVVTGFQTEIRNKVIGFGSHIQISNFDANTSYEFKPIDKNQTFYPAFNKVPGIKHIQAFAIKPGIIKTDTDIEGVLLKGIGSDFDWSFFKNKIIEGNPFLVKDSVKSDKVVLSKYTALRLKLKVGDNLYMYFIQEPPRVRKFVISGIYDTGFTVREFCAPFYGFACHAPLIHRGIRGAPHYREYPQYIQFDRAHSPNGACEEELDPACRLYTNTLRERGMSRQEAILHACPVRLRPILMTTLAMVFGMMPVAFGIGEGSETRSPMGISVIGGLLTSLFLTLLVVPAAYDLFDDWLARFVKKRKGRGE